MKPGAIVVAALSLVLAGSAVIWLASSVEKIDVKTVNDQEEIVYPEPSASGPQQKIELDHTSHDFGKMLLNESG